MSEVPHPFVVKPMALLAKASEESKRKLRLLHLTIADPSSEKVAQMARSGFRVFN